MIFVDLLLIVVNIYMEYKHDMRALAGVMSKKTGIFRKDCEKILYAMFDEIREGIKGGEGFTITNFGRFEYKVQYARKVRDIDGNEIRHSPPKTNIHFTPCKDLKYGVRALGWEDYITDEQKTKDWYQMQLDFEDSQDKE